MQWFRQNTWPIAGMAGVAVFLLVLWKLPEWQAPSSGLSPKERADVENDARVTIAQIVGGVALLVTVYFTWRRVGAAEKTVALAEQGQITERFTRAVEQLGSESLAIRLGGIYALERIARDSVRDHWPIMEILTAFVRTNARWRGPDEDRSDPTEPPEPRTDIQAILTVLGRRDRSTDRESDRQIDLGATDLRGADLRGARFDGAILHWATLEEANLDDAILTRANLNSSILTHANLSHANLAEATLLRANLVRARLGEQSLLGEPISGANLEAAFLVSANLRGAYLGRAILRQAYLGEADLTGAYLVGANLSRATLFGANLSGVDLGGANLAGAYLSGVDLRLANNLTQAQIDSAILDGDTQLPEGLVWSGGNPAAGEQPSRPEGS